MAETTFRTACFLCRRSMRLGHGIYEGEQIAHWNIAVCVPCLDENPDGPDPEQHPKLLAYMEVKGIAPFLNADGFLAWPRLLAAA